MNDLESIFGSDGVTLVKNMNVINTNIKCPIIGMTVIKRKCNLFANMNGNVQWYQFECDHKNMQRLLTDKISGDSTF